MAASCAQKPTTEFLCFNTQPPEGGCVTTLIVSTIVSPFQHTATRRWLLSSFEDCISVTMFQHTATRRWLRAFGLSSQAIFSFNTQPPEGGCASVFRSIAVWNGFNTQPPEGGCPFTRSVNDFASRFQHTATRRWLLPSGKIPI